MAHDSGRGVGVLDSRGSADAHVAAYRPDIDGLRAVAVVSVVLYHLHNGLIPGGFLGVDIFFVISGYLISLILWREISTDKFKISKFYERRIRRIMPALLFVLISTIAFAAVILLPVDLVGFAKSCLATMVFAANIYFWRDSDYFSRVAAEKPLLHLWSLGVEEQFYILFPLVLFLCSRFARRWTLSAVVGLLLVSFGLNILLVKAGGGNPAFYLLPTRAWELAGGAALALARPAVIGRLATEIASIVGLLLIGISFVLGQGLELAGLPVPTLAVAGAMLVIWSGASPRGLVKTVLASKPMVSVGLISYSLYLWHWPILVLAKYWLVGELDVIWSIVAVAAMVLMAYLSWRFVERPFRSKDITVKMVLAWTLAGVLIVCASAIGLILSRGLPQRLSPQAAAINSAVGTHFRCPVQDYVVAGLSRGCVMNLPSRKPEDADIVMIGNSHALMYTPLMAEILASRGLHGVLLNANSCLPSTTVNLNTSCSDVAGRYISEVTALKAKIVFIGLQWDIPDRLVDSSGRPYPGSVVDGAIAGVSDTIEKLEKAGKTVVLIGPIAQPGWDVASIESRSLAFGHQMGRPTYRTRAAFDQQMGPIVRAFETRPDVILIRPDLVQCREDRCNYIVDGQSLFSDESHLARGALARFRPEFEAALDGARQRAR